MMMTALHEHRRLVLPAVLLVLVAAAFGAFRAWQGFAHRDEIAASGMIEFTQASLAPKVQGRLFALRVHDGDAVRKGQVLAVLEDTVPALDRTQAEANLVAATSQLAAARAAYALQREQYSTTIAQAREGVSIAQSSVGQANDTLAIERSSAALTVDQARAQLLSSEATFTKAATDLSRARSLVRTGDEAQQRLDDARVSYVASQTQVRAARDALALAQANARMVSIRRFALASARSQHSQTVASLDAARAQAALVDQRRAEFLAAQAQVEQARAQVGLAQNQVHETRITAPFDGAVISHDAEPGDLIAPGAPLITLADVADPYVYVYVSESQLPFVKTGMRADVRIDGMPNRTFIGRVTEIADQAEFTPQNVQTKQDRVEYLVFRVKLQMHDPSGVLKAGLPVDAIIHV